MKPLTLYIMKSDNMVVCPESVVSFGGVVEEVIFLDNRNLEEAVKSCKTRWFGYIFSNEYLQVDLGVELLLYLEQDKFDVIIFMQRLLVDDKFKFLQSPRLFKREIKLKGMYPLTKNFTHIRALDGFVEIYNEN